MRSRTAPGDEPGALFSGELFEYLPAVLTRLNEPNALTLVPEAVDLPATILAVVLGQRARLEAQRAAEDYASRIAAIGAGAAAEVPVRSLNRDQVGAWEEKRPDVEGGQ